MIHQTLEAVKAAQPESDKKRPYRLYTEAGEAAAHLEVFTWATCPQEAKAIYATSLGIEAELVDGGRRKVGFRTKLRELATRAVRSKAAEALLTELQGLLREEEILTTARAAAKAAEQAAAQARETDTPNGEPGDRTVQAGDEQDEVEPDFDEDDDGEDTEEVQIFGEDGEFEDEDGDNDDDLPATDDEPEEDPIPPGGEFEDEDTDDFSGWKGGDNHS